LLGDDERAKHVGYRGTSSQKREAHNNRWDVSGGTDDLNPRDTKVAKNTHPREAAKEGNECLGNLAATRIAVARLDLAHVEQSPVKDEDDGKRDPVPK